MIYYLLKSLSISAITVRTLFALITSFTIVLLLLPVLIRSFNFKKVGQPVRKGTPDTHQQKAGTPTMGGVVVVAAILFTAMAWCGINLAVMWVLFIMLTMALLGFVDDLKKISEGNSNGISGKTKLIVQFLVGTILGIWLKHEGLDYVFIPGIIKTIKVGWFIVPISAFIIAATSNSVNLTDGLDGLATGQLLIAIFAYIPLIYIASHKYFSAHVQVPFFPQAGELTVLTGAIVGALLGFLWYNSHPASIFMGDTGSLSLGAALGSLALLIKQELLLSVIGFIFVAESMSVILQVLSVKFRDKRIFLRSPIHHHFELKGWSETKVVIRFWIIGIIMAIFGIAIVGLGVIIK